MTTPNGMSSVNMYQSNGTSDLVAAAGYTDNDDSQLTDLTYTTGAGGTGTVLAGYHWDYNASGVVTDMYSHNDSSAGTPNTSYVSGSSNWGKATYSYDPTAQLLGAELFNQLHRARATTDSGETYDPQRQSHERHASVACGNHDGRGQSAVIRWHLLLQL